MDHKTWLWRKKTSEKTIVATDKANLSSKENEEEKEVDLKSLVTNLNERLASVLQDCDAKDDILANHAKTTQEAIADRKKVEKEALSLKQELDEALLQNVSANETITYLNSALKESMKQLSTVREDQEKSKNDAEKAHKKLENRLTETSKRLETLMVENSHLSDALLLKENVIQTLNRSKTQKEAEFDALMSRLESTEKENSFLKYEFRVLEKEVEIRNEEMEFIRRSADASDKQHLESLNKVSKLEAECQRLRVLMRKRLPGPAAFAKMRSEVDIHGRNHTEIRRRNMNTVENSSEGYGKNASFLIGRLSIVEEENKILKELLTQKDDELHYAKSSFTRTSSQLSQVEDQLRDLLKDPKLVKLALCAQSSDDMSLSSCFETGSNDVLVSSKAGASALISQAGLGSKETKNTSEHKVIGISDMSLMDDFVEMEKLAIVAVDGPSGSPRIFSDVSNTLSNRLISSSSEHDSDITGKEIVLLEPHLENSNVCWLQDVLNAILYQNRVSKKSLEELLEEVKLSLFTKSQTRSKNSDQTEMLPISGYITWKTPTSSPLMDCRKKMSDIGILAEDREGPKNELQTVKTLDNDLQAMLKNANDKNDELINQLRQSEEQIGSLQTELKTLKKLKGMIEDQLEHQKLANEDLAMQLTIAKSNFAKLFEKLSYLEVELEERSRCCEEFEATCLELGLQLESVTSKEFPKVYMDHEKNLLETDWEISAASAKLSECQETIFNLGKQLQALASRKETTECANAKLTSNITKFNSKLTQHSSLREMLDEHNAEPINFNSPKTNVLIATSETKTPSTCHSKNQNAQVGNHYIGRKHETKTPMIGSMAIIPSKKHAGGSSLLKKLFLRRKKGSGVRRSLSFRT